MSFTPEFKMNGTGDGPEDWQPHPCYHCKQVTETTETKSLRLLNENIYLCQYCYTVSRPWMKGWISEEAMMSLMFNILEKRLMAKLMETYK